MLILSASETSQALSLITAANLSTSHHGLPPGQCFAVSIVHATVGHYIYKGFFYYVVLNRQVSGSESFKAWSHLVSLEPVRHRLLSVPQDANSCL